MAAAVRINRYLAAAGLGTRREVEGLLRTGRVTLNGRPCSDPSLRVEDGDKVQLDGRSIMVTRNVGVALHRVAGTGIEIVHPAPLVPVLPLPEGRSGIELLLTDAALAKRLGDSRFPLSSRTDAMGRRTRLGGIDLEELPAGDWRPLSPKELAALRRGARLPPSSG